VKNDDMNMASTLPNRGGKRKAREKTTKKNESNPAYENFKNKRKAKNG
jgi:hypothetical protein